MRTAKEQEEINQVLYMLWCEWVDNAEKEGHPEKEIDFFMKQTGAGKDSVAVIMYEAFLAGVAKGLKFADERN